MTIFVMQRIFFIMQIANVVKIVATYNSVPYIYVIYTLTKLLLSYLSNQLYSIVVKLVLGLSKLKLINYTIGSSIRQIEIASVTLGPIFRWIG